MHGNNVYFLNYKNYNLNLLKNFLLNAKTIKKKSGQKTNKIKNYLPLKHIYFLKHLVKKLKKTNTYKKFNYFLITLFKKSKKNTQRFIFK